MKRTGYIYDKVCDLDNIKEAILKASLGKRHRPFVKEVVDAPITTPVRFGTCC